MASVSARSSSAGTVSRDQHRLTTVHDNTYASELLVSNKSNGWRDLIAIVDLATYRRIPWERNMPFFLVRFIVPETMTGLEVDPRSVMSNVVKRASDKGLTCMSGAEFEVDHMYSTH